MSVEVKDGVLYSDGQAIYDIPEAEQAPRSGHWISRTGVFYSNGEAMYRLSNPHEICKVEVQS